jgi:hypothetical protein
MVTGRVGALLFSDQHCRQIGTYLSVDDLEAQLVLKEINGRKGFISAAFSFVGSFSDEDAAGFLARLTRSNVSRISHKPVTKATWTAVLSEQMLQNCKPFPTSSVVLLGHSRTPSPKIYRYLRPFLLVFFCATSYTYSLADIYRNSFTFLQVEVPLRMAGLVENPHPVC